MPTFKKKKNPDRVAGGHAKAAKRKMQKMLDQAVDEGAPRRFCGR